MIVYFAPDCSHCQHLMFEMKPKMQAFKDIQVVMITFVQQLKAIQVFYRDYDLKKFPNFTVGTEGYTYVVQKYYQVRTTPFIALYDKDGKLVKSYEKPPAIDELTAEVKKI
jgi:thiol-disulfide isomerase/thioredoxin